MPVYVLWVFILQDPEIYIPSKEEISLGGFSFLITNYSSMNKVIKIGFLFPYSSIHPDLTKDIIDGFYAAIPQKFKKSFQFFPEYIDLGKKDLVKVAINKLVSFHNVDIISGFISYKSIPDIIPAIQQRNKIGFFFDMGEYLPPVYTLPVDLFVNSFLIWQMEYALGNWSQSTYKGKGAMLMSVYDAGYHMHSAFWQGAISAGATEIDMHIIPYNPDQSSILPVLPGFFEKIEKSKVDYLHVLFCGNEAVDFFRAFKESSLYGKIPLVVSPHMASDEIINMTGNLDIKCYSASGWNYYSTSEHNQSFKKVYESATGKKASLFAVMGYEAGLAFLNVLPDLLRDDKEAVRSFFKNGTITGPRGVRNFYLGTKLNMPDIEIEKITFQPLKPLKIIIEQGKAMPYNHSVFSDIHNLCISGWENPYLCV
jgi:branched-chain amino acid transport system substrate-binding protein